MQYSVEAVTQFSEQEMYGAKYGVRPAILPGVRPAIWGHAQIA